MSISRKIASLFCAFALAGCGGGGDAAGKKDSVAAPTPPANNRFEIAAYNNSDWPEADFADGRLGWANSLPHLQKLINEGPGAAWGFSCTITRATGLPVDGQWALVSQSYCPDPYAGSQGVHLGRVAFVGYARSAPNTPENTAWHELVELMGAAVSGHEIVDPVAPYKFGFCFPSYFTGGAAPWDNLGKCPAAGTPAPGGFNGG